MSTQGKFVWFELVTRDVKKAQAFYGEVLGWKVQSSPMGGPEPYDLIIAGDRQVGGIVKLTGKGEAHWTSYVSVHDVDAALARVKAAGGKALEAPLDIPTVGRMALCADAQGASFHLFKGAGPDQPEAAPAPGTFFWNELLTPEPERAVAFYKDVLGYAHKPMDMGPMGTYHVLEHGEKPRAGIMKPQMEIPAQWLPYVAVGDCDATLARAVKLGATQQVPPTDIPEVGRFAVLTDPTGATIAIIKPVAAAK